MKVFEKVKIKSLVISVAIMACVAASATNPPPSSQPYDKFENRGVAYTIPNHSFEFGKSAFLINGSPAPIVTDRGYYGSSSIKLINKQKALWEVAYDEATMGKRKTLSTGVWVYIDGDKGTAGITLECMIGGEYVEVSKVNTGVTKRWFYLKTPFMSDVNAQKNISRIRIGLYSESANNVYFDFVQMGDWQRFNGNHEKMVIMSYQPWFGDVNAPDSWGGWAYNATAAGGERYDPTIFLNPGTPDQKRNIASVYYPLTGAYKSNDREVLELHIQLIKAMGFDVIQVNYYAERTPYQKEVLDILFDLSLNYDIKMSILYEPKIHNSEKNSLEQRIKNWGDDMINFINKYKDHKSLLQYNGRVLIGSFDYNNVTDEEWGVIIERVKKETGYMMALSSQTINLRSNRSTEGYSTKNIESAFIWSLWHENFRNWDEDFVKSYNENLQTRVIKWNEENHFSKLPMAMVYPGFDDTPIRAWARTPPGIIRKIAGTGPLFYNASWDSFMKYKDHLDWINIATYNDWTEGSILEPSREHGHELAYITSKRIAEWKGGTPLPVAIFELITAKYMCTRTSNYK